jgi:hypothetical protein
VTDDEERLLRQELLRMDVNLRTKQAGWETPKNIAILAAAMAAVIGAGAGFIGYKIGREPPAPIVIQLQPTPK